ncbi:MAG: SurA N-terminal domain-containing protein [Novosphingobium sp.]|nr:SurA N-terminal domain-containing protein [Novosphingobium sp.]
MSGIEEMTGIKTTGWMHAALRLPILVAALLTLSLSWGNPASAQTRVVALVNDEPITSYDVQARAKFMSVVSRKALNGALRAQALEELIDEVLKFQEARRLGVKASEGTVDGAYAGIAERLKMTPAKLTAAFRSAGVNPDTLRKRIESDVVWKDVVRQRFRQEVNVREQDVVQAMGASGKPVEETTTEFELQKIVVILPKNPSNATIAERKRVAETFRQQFQNCAGTHDLTRQFEGIVWSRIGRKVATVFNEADRQRLMETGENQVTQPLQTKNALEMFAVCSRREVQDDTAARQEAQNELMNQRGQVLARRLLIDLKQSALIVRK